MGADFIYATVPACNHTEEREAEFKECLLSLREEDFEYYNEVFSEPPSEDQLLHLAASYWNLGDRRDCGDIQLDGKVLHWITGGMSWGDDPTDSYSVMSVIAYFDKAYNLLDKWAKDDCGEVDNEQRITA